ncbi:MAG TPA: prepilin-type N-terminal cleavage/methylation domain-containing protein [Thermoleophilaceae bacterium]
MNRSFLTRLRSNRGFSLIELLVTIMILALIAAIAIPSYMGHQKKGKDSDAQSNARNLTSRIELCFATQEDYRDCDSNEELGEDTGLPYGTSPGQVSVVTATDKSYKVTAISKAESDGSNHTFTVEHQAAGNTDRTCTAGSTNKNGSCRNGSW